MAIESNAEHEFVRYCNAPLAEDGTNVLAFWKANSFNYPILSDMAKDYLTVQASILEAK